MQLTVVLGASGEASFDITLNDNSFVHKWIEELRWCLDNCDFNQRDAFDSQVTLQEAADIVLDSCETINRYVKNFIQVRSNLLAQPQEYFNYLHRQFETLSGIDRPTRLFLVANKELKDAIRNLNHYLHRVETKKETYPNLYVNFDKDKLRKIPLSKEDYKYTEFSGPAGTTYLHYIELGKNFKDLYEDNLNLMYPAFKNLQHYSGEFSISFRAIDCFDDIKYLNWIKNQNLDPFNKELGHGIMPLGTVTELSYTIDAIQKYKHLNKILIKE